MEEYKIVFCTQTVQESKEEAIKRMEEEVNKMLANGWHRTGGIAVDKGTYFQAIFRNKEEE